MIWRLMCSEMADYIHGFGLHAGNGPFTSASYATTGSPWVQTCANRPGRPLWVATGCSDSYASCSGATNAWGTFSKDLLGCTGSEVWTNRGGSYGNVDCSRFTGCSQASGTATSEVCLYRSMNHLFPTLPTLEQPNPLANVFNNRNRGAQLPAVTHAYNEIWGANSPPSTAPMPSFVHDRFATATAVSVTYYASSTCEHGATHATQTISINGECQVTTDAVSTITRGYTGDNSLGFKRTSSTVIFCYANTTTQCNTLLAAADTSHAQCGVGSSPSKPLATEKCHPPIGVPFFGDAPMHHSAVFSLVFPPPPPPSPTYLHATSAEFRAYRDVACADAAPQQIATLTIGAACSQHWSYSFLAENLHESWFGLKHTSSSPSKLVACTGPSKSGCDQAVASVGTTFPAYSHCLCGSNTRYTYGTAIDGWTTDTGMQRYCDDTELAWACAADPTHSGRMYLAAQCCSAGSPPPPPPYHGHSQWIASCRELRADLLDGSCVTNEATQGHYSVRMTLPSPPPPSPLPSPPLPLPSPSSSSSPSLSSPSPSSSQPPPPPVVLTFTSSLSVSEFGGEAQQLVKVNVARTLGVSESLVQVSVEAASVRVTVTISTASSEQATSFKATLENTLSSVDSATAALGVPVVSTPNVIIDTSGSGVGDDDSGGAPVGIIAGGASGGVALIVAFVIYLKCRRTTSRTKPTMSSTV